jgi:dTDP-D-glucose 4,6-dehydratase
MKGLATVGLAPFAPYHWLLYAESLWFDTNKAQTELDWRPQHSNASALVESYDWFLANRASLEGEHRSHHQSSVRLGLLEVLKRLP